MTSREGLLRHEGAEVLVTGDKDLLAVRNAVQDLGIIDPRGLWELLRRAER